MDDGRLNRLERLQNLRAAGTLSDTEFNAEKGKLLAGSPLKSPRLARWLVYGGLGAALLASATWLGFWSVRNDGVPAQPTSSTRSIQRSPAAAANLIAPRDPRLPVKRLSDAFYAATGHHTAFTVSDGQDVITTTPLRILNFAFGPVLLTKTEIKDGCHACTGAIGVFYLDQTDDGVSIKKSWPKAVSGWGWGAAPLDWHITDKFTKYPAIYASGGYTGQGITESSATITELRPDGPITSDIIHIGYTNEGAVVEGEGRVCTVDGKIANIRRDHSFDVIISGSTRAVDRYVKRNDRFSPVSNVDWDMHCGTGT